MAVTEGQLITDGTAVWKVKKIGSEVPAGIMQMFAGNTIPAGWLLCDGSAISRTDYAELFEVIGTTYGAGDGSTTFNLPNLIDRVVQGAATAGTYKEAGLPNITGGNLYITHSASVLATGALSATSAQLGKAQLSTIEEGWREGVLSIDASRSNSIYGNSTTVQPPALTMLPIIKY